MKVNKRVTIKDLSRYLSLSTSTISRAFLNNQNINPDTKTRILEAAKQLNYTPNRIALNLKSGKTKTIGVIVPEMTTPYSITVLKGIERVLCQKDYHTIIKVSDEDQNKERQNILFFEELKVDALIVSTCNQSENIDLYQRLIQNGTPIIFHDRLPNPTINASKVIVKDSIYSFLMVEHLVNIGRKNIAHIIGPSIIGNAKEREIGYERILHKYHIYNPNLKIQVQNMSIIDGENAVKKLIENNVSFDAIFVFSDILAIGAMNYLLKNGYRIPEDVAIASFSGTILSSMVYPQLTTVESPLEEMGEQSALLALNKIDNPKSDNQTIVLDSQLVYRSSTIK